MAVTLGASAFLYNPGFLGDIMRASILSQYSGDGAANTIVLEPPNDTQFGGRTRILAIHATYETAADTGDIDITTENTVDPHFGYNMDAIYTLAAGGLKTIQIPQPMEWDFSAGDISVVLDAGTTQSSLTVWYLIGSP